MLACRFEGSGLGQGMTSISSKNQQGGGLRGGAGVQAQLYGAPVATGLAKTSAAVSAGATAAAAGTEMVYRAGRWVPQAVAPPDAPTVEEEDSFYSRYRPAPEELVSTRPSASPVVDLEAVDVEVGPGKVRRPSKAALPRRR